MGYSDRGLKAESLIHLPSQMHIVTSWDQGSSIATTASDSFEDYRDDITSAIPAPTPTSGEVTRLEGSSGEDPIQKILFAESRKESTGLDSLHYTTS